MSNYFDKLVSVLDYLFKHTELFCKVQQKLRNNEELDECGPPQNKATFCYNRFYENGKLNVPSLYLAVAKNETAKLTIHNLFNRICSKKNISLEEFELLIAGHLVIDDDQEHYIEDILEKMREKKQPDHFINVFYLLFKNDIELYLFARELFDVMDDYYNCYETLIGLQLFVRNWMKRILKAIILYYYLYIYYSRQRGNHVSVLTENKKELLNMGLIGPGFGRLTKWLEYLLGRSKTLQRHALYHDVFGRLNTKYELGCGYTYVYKFNSRVKKWPLIGHIGGLIYNFFNWTSKIYI